MIVLHGLKACDNCRKALKTLTENGVDARLRDVRGQPVTTAEVAAWHARFGGTLLNTRSTTWRALSEAKRAGDPIALMVTHPTLIKRPVVETPQDLHLGWTATTREALGLSF